MGASAARDSQQQNAAVSSIRHLARVAGQAVVDQLLLADDANEKVFDSASLLSLQVLEGP